MAKFIPLETSETINPLNGMWNPLRFLSIPMAEQLLDNYRTGRMSNIQLLFEIVEDTNLTLQMCIERRLGAIRNNDWTIKNRDAKRIGRNYDAGLQQAQSEFLNAQFTQAEDSGTLLPAIEHLAHATFNGIGVVAPIYTEEGLTRFELYDPWNFAVSPKRDRYGQPVLYWNPTGQDVLDFEQTLERIPSEQIIANICKPIDRFGLLGTLAESLGVDSYNSLIARKGLPATYIIASEDVDPDSIKEWAKKAVDAAKGGSGCFPFGSNVITETIDANNGAAIQAYLEWLQKQIVLASTGGTLQSLTEATGLGSNVAEMQAEVFKSIVRSDCSKIGDLINRGVANVLLDAKFPGKPHLVYFDLLGEEKAAPEKYLNDAVLAHNAGLEVDIDQLSELTGYKLAPIPTSDSNTWTPSLFSKPAKSDKEEWADDARKINEEHGDVVTNAEEPEEAPEEVTDSPEDEQDSKTKQGSALLRAFDKMLLPLRKLFARLLHAKDEDESRQIEDEINAEIARLENADETEYQKAVENLLKNEFEQTAKENLDNGNQK